MPRDLFFRIAKFFPGLKEKLWKAGVYKEPEQFLKETFIAAFILTTFLVGSIFVIFSSFRIFKTIMFVILIPIVFVMVFFYMINLPTILITKRIRMIDKDIISTGRQILVQIKSGVPLFNVIEYIGKQELPISIPFREIANNISLGVTLEDAITDTMRTTPSDKLKRLFSQMLNSLNTGAELSGSISGLIEQITKEQIIEIKRYGKKLNPLAMFYMLIAVIVPTLGITIMIIIGSFLAVDINLFILFILLGFLSFIQLMFLNMIRKSRPLVDL